MNEVNANHFSREGLVSIGKIVGLHGFKGVLKLRSYVESAAFFGPGQKIWVRNTRDEFHHCTIVWVKPHKRGFLFFLKEVFTAEESRGLIDAELFVEREKMPEPEEGQYYWVDLLGLMVFTVDGLYLGRLENIFTTGSNDVYVVKDSKKEILIPALESVVRKIDLTGKTMCVQLPEGL